MDRYLSTQLSSASDDATLTPKSFNPKADESKTIDEFKPTPVAAPPPATREKIYASARAYKRLKTTHQECTDLSPIDRFEEYLATTRTSCRELTL